MQDIQNKLIDDSVSAAMIVRGKALDVIHHMHQKLTASLFQYHEIRLSCNASRLSARQSHMDNF